MNWVPKVLAWIASLGPGPTPQPIYPHLESVRTPPVCDSLLSGVRNANEKIPVSEVFRADFTAQDREFVAYRYNLSHVVPGERNRDKIVRLLYVLREPSSGRILWKHEDFFQHVPNAVVLHPNDPDIAFVAKPIEMMFAAEEAPGLAKPHKSLKGIHSFIAWELLKFYVKDGVLYASDLGTLKSKVTMLSFTDDGLSLVTERRGAITINVD